MQITGIRRKLWSYRERLLAYVLLLATVGLILWAVWPSLNDHGYLTAWDAGGHLLKASYFAHHLLPLGHLSGWFPLWHGGFDLFQFYPPLLYYLLGPLTLVMQPELALRLFTAALWVGLIPVTYYFLRSFGLRPVLAALGSSFILALNASFGVGPGALYGVGLLPNGLGFILAVFLLGRLKRDLSEPSRSSRQLLLTGLVFGLLVLAHTFSAYWWLGASLLLVVTEAVGRKNRLRWFAKRYVFVLAIGLLVAAYWWIPLLLNLGSMGPTGGIEQDSRLEIMRRLLLAKDSGGWLVVVLAAAGLGHLALRRSWRTLSFFVGIALMTLLLSLNTINTFLPFSAVVSSTQHVRFEAFFSWTMIVLAAFGLAGVWHGLRWLIRLPFVPATAFAGIFVLLFALVIFPTFKEKRGFVAVADNEATRALPGLAAYLDTNLRPGEFVLSEFNWSARYDFGSPHFVNQHLPLLSKKAWDLDGNFPEGTNGAQRPVLVASVLDNTRYLATQQDYLKGRGIRYIITTQPTSQQNLLREPWLRLAWSQEDAPRSAPSDLLGLQRNVLAVFELRGFNQAFGLPTDVAGQLTSVRYDDPGHYQLRFREPVSLPAASSLALSYHPWLGVTADGQAVPVGEDAESRLILTAGARDVQTIDITYQPPLISRISKALSILALFGVIILLAKPGWLLALVNHARPNLTYAGRTRRGKPRTDSAQPKH